MSTITLHLGEVLITEKYVYLGGGGRDRRNGYKTKKLQILSSVSC